MSKASDQTLKISSIVTKIEDGSSESDRFNNTQLYDTKQLKLNGDAVVGIASLLSESESFGT
jgi:hypothetical protein